MNNMVFFTDPAVCQAEQVTRLPLLQSVRPMGNINYKYQIYYLEILSIIVYNI